MTARTQISQDAQPIFVLSSRQDSQSSASVARELCVGSHHVLSTLEFLNYPTSNQHLLKSSLDQATTGDSC